jgi:hypothetical protein
VKQQCYVFDLSLTLIYEVVSINVGYYYTYEERGKYRLFIFSLEGHTLSQKLSWLLSDREHLLSCFEKYAYLCQEKYGEATLICLRAVEQNQPSLLTEIDPCLVCICMMLSII